MARIMLPSVEIPLEALRIEMEKWLGGEAGNDQKNIEFLRAACRAFEEKAVAYYKAGETGDERLRHLDDVCQTFRETGFTKGDQLFTLAAGKITVTEDGVLGENCRPNEVCTGGMCMPVSR